jgi:hypothetical protein
MSASGKRAAICGILLSQIFCIQALAGENTNTPSYQTTVDTETSNFDEGVWKYKFTSYSGGNVILEEGKKHTFLVINGGISSEKVVIENGRAYIGLDGICGELNLSKEETKDAITVGNSQNRVILDKKSLLLKKGSENLGIKVRSIDNEIYVPVREFSEMFHAAVTYSTDMMPLFNPVVSVDNREKGVSKEQALHSAKQKLQEYFQEFEPEHTYRDKAVMDGAIRQIQDGIDHMQCVGETASFWLLKGPCLLFVDKATGEIYYKTGNGKAGHGSYMEIVQSLDGNADALFDYIVISGS